MKKICLITIGLLITNLSLAQMEEYATDAVAVVNPEVIKITKNTNNVDIEERISSQMNEIIDNSYKFDNSKEIEKLLEEIKDKKLNNKFSANIKNLNDAHQRARYITTWKFLKDLGSSKGIGIFDNQEFDQYVKRIEHYQQLRVRYHKNKNFIKDDLKTIELIKENYAKLRKKQLEISESVCTEEIDWSTKYKDRRGQTDTGWCYAHSLADIIESKIQTKISSADLVLKYNEKQIQYEIDRHNRKAPLYNQPLITRADIANQDYIFSGGNFTRIFERKEETIALCAEDDLRSEAKDKSGEPVAMGYIATWINLLGNQLKNGAITETQASKLLEDFDYRQIFPNANLDKSFQDLYKSKELDLYQVLARNTCKDKEMIVKNPFYLWVDQGYTISYRMNETLKDLAKQLHSGPVLVTLNSAFLWKENTFEDKNSDHNLIITGKRWRNNKCEFKIRNSQTTLKNQDEKVWYTDSEILRNITHMYIPPVKN